MPLAIPQPRPYGRALRWAAYRARLALNLLDAHQRTLPDFVIIGAQRSGTTSLFNTLARHPRVAPALRKEVHFFDIHYPKGLRWYRAHFVHQEQKEREGLLAGEATPYYLFHPLAPQRMAQHLPNARFIVLLRNPIDRALSHYHHIRRYGLEPLPTFEQAIAAEQERLKGQEELLLSGGLSYSPAHQNFSYLARGIYAAQLRRWFQYFPKERFLILRAEDFFASPGQVWPDVLTFLGLEQWTPPRFPVEDRLLYSQIPSETRNRLREFFMPYNQELYALIGRDMGWE